MTEQMESLIEMTRMYLGNQYGDYSPSLDEIKDAAKLMRSILTRGVGKPQIDDSEFEVFLEHIDEYFCHNIGRASTITGGRNSVHQKGWYNLNNSKEYFWKRFRIYLTKKWGKEIVSRLDETTNQILDNFGNPKSSEMFQRRGLLLGDVQSGKTATYTALCNKSADAGYRVIIVLTGTTEALRRQTQERLDLEFVGKDSQFLLEKNMKGKKTRNIGVGKIKLDLEEQRITLFTSIEKDFSSNIINSNGLNLKDLNGTALFVVKKNSRILKNLYAWLTKDESKEGIEEKQLIDLPMLLIDDEADNASINTNDIDESPTAINSAINKILRAFKQATYVGVTATPFANIFIDPSLEEDEASKDLFPRDFITLLPTPENYIGAGQIFGDTSGEYSNEYTGNKKVNSPIVPIFNDEQEFYFRFKHKKDLAEDLYTLPQSLKEAIRYFILVTAISDANFSATKHRSMLINVTRFNCVQEKIMELVDGYVRKLKSDVKNYAQMSDKEQKVLSLIEFKQTWDKYKLDEGGIKEGKKTWNKTWEDILTIYLPQAIKRIEVRIVNQKTGGNSLNYREYEKTGLRVIAIGGLSLSRGLTLEGLCVSYFYRNSMMYDSLLQMARWFGYRPGYSKLCKLWIGEDIIEWYKYILDSVNELKDDISQMEKHQLTPKDFGLRVKAAPGALLITARNKMRSGQKYTMPISLSARLIETPRLIARADTIKQNNLACEDVIRLIDSYTGNREYDSVTNAFIWKNVPKSYVIDLIGRYSSHPWNLNFQSEGLKNFIKSDSTLDYWDVAIPCGICKDLYKLNLNNDDFIEIRPQKRNITKDFTADELLKISGKHVRVGAGACTKIGLSKQEIEKLRTNELADKVKDSTFLNTERRPLMLVHLLYNSNESLKEFPTYIYAIGLGFPKGEKEKTAEYVYNEVAQEGLISETEVEYYED